ncbi:MAG: hypothetical protein JSR44_00210 [Spirochaetes bacterium]|nr:hypothetical protein [Spirochaetota bacterium]
MLRPNLLIKFNPINLLALLLACTGAIVADNNAYVGVNAYVSQWQMGFASGKPINFANTTFSTNSAKPLIYMAGLSFSFVHNKTWAITYQGEVGTAAATIDYIAPQSGTELKSAPTILRTDHNLAVTRTLGQSGFSIFAGGKVQYFGYFEPNGTFVQASPTVEAAYNESKNLLNVGPAAGFTYMFKLTRQLYLALQTSFIYFLGTYTDKISLTVSGNNVGLTQNEKYIGLGGTALISFITPLSEKLLLQISARGQYYTTRSTEAQVTNLTATGATKTSDASNSAVMDNVQDILLGAQLAVIYRIF